MSLNLTAMDLNNQHGKLIGVFWFKKTQNGNLVGELSNTNSAVISSKSVDTQMINSSNDFKVKYTTTWQQNGEEFIAKLIIVWKQGATQNRYSLEWKDSNGNKTFVGEGIIIDNILIGDYRDFEIY